MCNVQPFLLIRGESSLTLETVEYRNNNAKQDVTYGMYFVTK